MRFFLVPISTKRAFIYCRPPKTLKAGYVDRVTNKAAETWAKWERAEKGWKKHLVAYGQVILQRIPYEEWGLKSIPPLNVSREIQEAHQQEKIDVMFPGNVIKAGSVLRVLRTLGTERQELHRSKMWWCLGLAPLTAPIAIIPLIPNIPFFYLMYRAWSHWRALSGSKHLIHLLDLNLIHPHAFPELENFYSNRLAKARVSSKMAEMKEQPSSAPETEKELNRERLLLTMEDGQELGKILETPGIAIEVERAVLQIGQKMKVSKGEAKAEKKDT